MPTESAVLAPKSRHNRITASIAEQIATLVVKYRMTESEACLHSDISPNAWFTWKSRNKNTVRYDDVLTRIRAGQLSNVIQAIDRAGDGIGMKQPDWRAKAWIAERVLAPERFSDRQNQAQAAPSIDVSSFVKVLELVMAQRHAKQAQVIDVQSIPQLEQGNDSAK